MTARMFTCPACFKRELFSEIERNNYSCKNPKCSLSERLVVHSEQNSSGQVTKLYGWVLEPGELLNGKYEIQKLIGKGGYGATYLARYRELLKQSFAIKETPRIYCDNKEDEFLLNLSHPGIPRLFERFNNGGLHYMVMEFIEGESLESLVKNRPKAGLESLILKIAEQVCNVLGYIHSSGVVHRDLKPENILVRRNGSVAIVDFGIAKRFVPGVQTRHLARAASHFFSPPEQYDTGKGNTDPRSDIYSLGAILYYLLTGREPIDAVNRRDNEVITPLPKTLNPNISAKIESVIIQAMSMKPTDRFRSMEEFKHALITAGAVTTRVCPICGRLYRGMKNHCQECGRPTAPLGSSQNAPFVFRSGEKAINLQEFISACYQNWDDASWHLYQGDFTPWLNSIQEGALAARAANIRRLIQNRNLGLNQFLMSSPFGRPPKLEISHTKVEFTDVKPGIQKRVQVTIYNAGLGYLQGDIKIEKPHLTLDNYKFACFRGESQQISINLNADRLSESKNFKTSIVLDTNVGIKTIPVTVLMETPELQWKVEPATLHFSIRENQIVVKGFTIEVISPQGKLNGTLSASQPWIDLRPLEFSSRSQLIRVEIQPEGLKPGDYSGEILIKTPQGRKKIDVALQVQAAPVLKPVPQPIPPKARPVPAQAPSGVEPRPLRPKKVRPAPAIPWLDILSFQTFPALWLGLLFLTAHLFYPKNGILTPSSTAVIACAFIGALAGIFTPLREKLNNIILSSIVGLLLGLVLSVVWLPAALLIESTIQKLFIIPFGQIFNRAIPNILQLILFGILGIFFGGLFGLFPVVRKIKPSYNGLLIYLSIFITGFSFLASAIILIFGKV